MNPPPLTIEHTVPKLNSALQCKTSTCSVRSWKQFDPYSPNILQSILFHTQHRDFNTIKDWKTVKIAFFVYGVPTLLDFTPILPNQH